MTGLAFTGSCAYFPSSTSWTLVGKAVKLVCYHHLKAALEKGYRLLPSSSIDRLAGISHSSCDPFLALGWKYRNSHTSLRINGGPKVPRLAFVFHPASGNFSFSSLRRFSYKPQPTRNLHCPNRQRKHKSSALFFSSHHSISLSLRCQSGKRSGTTCSRPSSRCSLPSARSSRPRFWPSCRPRAMSLPGMLFGTCWSWEACLRQSRKERVPPGGHCLSKRLGWQPSCELFFSCCLQVSLSCSFPIFPSTSLFFPSRSP